MGRHESHTATESLLPWPQTPGGRRAFVAALLVLAVGAVVAVPLALLREGDGGRAGAVGSCGNRPSVSIVAAEQVVPVVRAAASRAAAGGTCASFQVSAVSSAAEAATILSGAAPEVWVPDSSVWVDQLNSAGPARAWVARGSVASSPVVLALPDAMADKAPGSPSWSRLMSGALPLRIADPDTDTTGRLALFSLHGALGSSATARKLAGAATVRLSHTVAPSEAELFRGFVDSPSRSAAFTASEQAVAAFNRDHPEQGLVAVVPREGTSVLDFPWVAAPGLDSARLEATDAVFRELRGPRAEEDLRRAGLRDPDGAGQPQLEGMPEGPVTQVDALPPQARVTALALWASVRTEMRMIAAIDVSGSMAWPAGGKSRVELAQGAAMTALATFPRATEVGLWEFSTGRGKGGRDWKQLAPIRPLEAKVGPVTQQELLTRALKTLPARLKGDTGLYDTVLAAVRAVRKGYDPDRVNSVVLLTDGINDDPSGITLTKLLATLRKEQVPDRPVRVVLVGMGPEADAATLAKIAEATDGASYVARDPKDITTVFVQALLSRG